MGIDNKFTILYSGTMGMKHNPQIIVDTANLLKNHKDILFIVVSEGEGADYISKVSEEENLNIKVFPFQDFKDLPKVLASADILLTILEKDAGVFSVPSKVWSYYCSSRASFLNVPNNNLSAKITISNNAGVLVKDNEDFANQIKYFKNNLNELKEMGFNARVYAENNFKIDNIANSFLKLIKA